MQHHCRCPHDCWCGTESQQFPNRKPAFPKRFPNTETGQLLYCSADSSTTQTIHRQQAMNTQLYTSTHALCMCGGGTNSLCASRLYLARWMSVGNSATKPAQRTYCTLMHHLVRPRLHSLITVSACVAAQLLPPAKGLLGDAGSDPWGANP